MSTLPIVGIHLDLKYVMPSKAYLNRWVAELPAAGVNTLLIEYEDKFPFRTHPFLRAPTAFTETELGAFLHAARGAGLRIIPLVQTLSHLEFALRHPQLAGLREAEHIHTQVDTSSDQGKKFVHGLIDDVMRFHGGDEFFHLGGDEAWHLGHNERTKGEVARLGEAGVWAAHTLEFVRKIAAMNKRPVLWEDVIEREPGVVAEHGFPKETVFVPWHYHIVTADHAERRLSHTRALRDAGHDLMVSPCLNWGVMTARHGHCLANTAELVRYAKANGYVGVINTAWACFSVLPHAQMLYAAATGTAAREPDAVLSPAWREAWCAEYFGVPGGVAGIDGALEAFGRLTEFSVGAERPITLVVHGYMDVLLMMSGLAERKALGVMPADMAEIDFDALLARKLALAQGAEFKEGAAALLSERLSAYEEHAGVFAALVRGATRHKKEAEYFEWAAEMKRVHARIMLRLISGTAGGAEGDALRWAALGERQRAVLGEFVEASDLDVLRAMWWAPTAGLIS